MVSVLILSHGRLAAELLDTARRIACRPDRVSALCLDWSDDLETHRERVAAAIAKVPRQEQLLILADMYGGTPYNVASELAAPGRVHVVAGVNLPMVVRLCCRDEEEMTVGELAEWIQQKGRRAICASGEKKKAPVTDLEPASG